MRFPKLALFVALLSPVPLAPAYARGGGGHGGGGVHAGGFRGGSFRSGFYGGRGYYWGPSFYFGYGGYGYPYFPYYPYDPYYGSYGYDSYGYDQDRPAPPQPQPQSTIRNNQGEQYFLIAFNDHSIQAATAYKVEGDQIHWIGRDGREQQAPLSSVDVRFSQQINRDRHVNFQIP